MKRGGSRPAGLICLLLLVHFTFKAGACGQGGNGTIMPVPSLGGSAVQVNGLNSAGQITGFSYTTGNAAAHAFRFGNGTLDDLGTLGGAISQGFAINGLGQVVGQADLDDFVSTHAVLYNGTNAVDLGTLGGSFSSATLINDAGQIAGQSLTTGDVSFEAFFYSNGSMTNLGSLGGGGTTIAAINQSGVIAGDSLNEVFEDHAFLYSAGTILDLGTLGGDYSAAFAINDSGVAVGESSLNTGEIHAFAYAQESMADLGTLGGTYSQAVAVNSAGQIIGAATTADDAETHAFITAGGAMTDLGTLGGTYSYACALNNKGQVVGQAAVPSGDSHAFVWQSGTLTDLNTLLPPNSGWQLSQGQFINDSGRIVGTGSYNGNFSWFVLDLSSQNHAPVANAGSDQIAECPSSVTLDASGSADPDGDALAYEWSESGTVLGTNVTLIVSFSLGNHTVTLKVTDPCGAFSQTNVTVLVKDTVPPTVSCPSTIQASVDNNCQVAVPNLLPQTLASDACTVTPLLSQVPTAGTLVSLGDHVIAVTATDASGNSASCFTLLKVVDSTAPSIVSVPGPITVSVDVNCQATVPNVLSQVVAADNCTPVNQLVLTQNPVAGTVVGPGQYNISVIVSDVSANSANRSVVLNVVDSTAPSIVSVPGPITVSVDANCQATVPDVLSQVVANDNCTPVNQLVLTQNPVAGTVVGSGQYNISVTASDAAGNTANSSVVLKVVDTAVPSIVSVPGPITVSVDANCQATVPNVLSQVVAADNCTPVNQLVLTQNPVAGTVVGPGQFSISVSVSDASGNSANSSVVLKVVDSTAPSIVSVPGPITVAVGANCQATVPNVLSQVVATDNCTPVNQLVLTQNPVAGTVVGSGQYNIRVTVSDAAGNSANSSVVLRVVDSTAPSIVSVPGPITVAVGANCQATVPNVLSQVVATDNCTPVNQLVLTQNPVAGTVVGSGQYNITVTVSDASGNSANSSVVLRVVDSMAPSIVSVPGPITVAVDANCQGTVPNVLSQVVATDDCTPVGQLVLTQSPAAGTLVPKGSYVITVTVTDLSGNSATKNVYLSVRDLLPPVIQSITANPSVLSPPNHQMVPVTLTVVATDNCDAAPVSKIVSVTCNETSVPGDVQITGNLTLNLAATRNPSGAGRVYTITVGCQDNSGNVSVGQVTVTVSKGNGH